MNPAPISIESLLDLEARHDDLLRQLDDLDRRVAKALAECQVLRCPTVGRDDGGQSAR